MDQPLHLLAINRRTAVFGLIGGGVALGFASGSAAKGARPEDARGSLVALGAYVEVTPAGDVVIYTPGAEMGQGVAHSLPKIIAEEMDADWSRVTVCLSGANDAFASPVNKKQRSGNSDAVITYYTPLRKVGAGLRAMLVAAAAKRWSAPVGECTARTGVVTHSPSGRTLSFGDLAADAAKISPPAAPVLKDTRDFTLIGRSFPRKDIPAKVDGSAIFGIDVRRPGMLYAAVRHSPVIGTTIKSYDKAKLLAQPGVKLVVDLDDAIAVVAESDWLARCAIEAVEVSSAALEGPPLTSATLSAQLHKALDDDAHALTWPTNIAGPLKPVDPAPVLSALDKGEVYEAIYEVPYLAHSTLEPPCCTALVNAHDCTVWGPLQAADAPRALVAKQTGLPLEAVTINRTYLGGGFGRKWENDFLLQSVRIAQAVPGVPVKLIWSREEDIRNDAYRPAHVARLRARVGTSGKPEAMHGRVTGQSIFAAKGVKLGAGIGDPNAALGLIADYYDVPLKLIDYVEVKAPLKVGYWRSVSQSQNAFFSETMIDELAHRAKQDPVAYRDALLGKAPRMRAVLRAVAEAADWTKPTPPGWGKGVALSAMDKSCAAQIAEVEIVKGQLHVRRIVCAFDCGLQIDPDSIVSQLEGGVVFGLSAALFGAISVADGQVVEGNFDSYRLVTLADMPKVEVHLVTSDAAPSGVGEAGPPGVAPAVCNAIFAATGQRIRTLPISSSGIKV